ncbi:protein abnormal spindle [Anopheles coustani]|uniref:protein abnormal spindle n=1 Tax=Anopheles coustani TaxID=139045 RepID=UPI00265B5CC7|nr:protein abnormal spindle [Anopheles coustani]
MSAFEVTCTPPRPVPKKTNEAREPTLVILGPFTPKAIVVFDGVPIGKTARRLLIVRNTNKAAVQVTLAKVPHPECGISFEWTSAEVDAGTERSLEVVWSPLLLIQGKEVLIISDSLGNKKDVQFILKAIELKPTSRKTVTKPFAVPKKLKLKSPSPPKVKLSRNVLPKRTKGSPLQRSLPAGSPTANSRMGSITSKVSNAVLGAGGEEDRLEQSDLLDEFCLSPAERKRIDKENINPTSPLSGTGQQGARQLLTPKLNSDNYISHIINQPTPECYLKIKARTNSVVSERKDLDVSPKLHGMKSVHQAEATYPTIKITDPYLQERIPLASNVLSSKTKNQQHDLTTTPLERTKFDPGCVSTITKATPFEQTYLKPYTGSPIATMETDLREEDNLQRHLSFSPENVPLSEPDIGISKDTGGGDIHRVPPKTGLTEVDDGRKLELSGVSDGIPSSEEAVRRAEDNGTINDKTHPLVHDTSSQLSIIAEETNQPELGVTFNRRQAHHNGSSSDVAELGLTMVHHQKTFTVASEENLRSSSVENIVRNVTVTIKDSISLCSMPNLHENSGSSTLDGEDEEVGRIFKEHEIRAQSSRFNLHEVGRYSDEVVPRVGTVDGGGLRPSAGMSCKRSLDTVRSGPRSLDPVTQSVPFESKISPPKRRCRNESASPRSNASIRNKKDDSSTVRSARKPFGYKPSTHSRSVTQSVNRTLTLKRPALPSTLPAKGEEKRIFLYDSDRHLKTLINPDPFAATTTTNPFMCASIYLDERAFERYERQMKKWLNALVTIPADLDTESNKPLDVGKLFDEVKCKELTLAPTKELISSHYYKNRLNSLRSAGISLYMSEELALPLRKVAAQIEKQQLALRTDRCLHLDLVLQRTALELLLCFNPLWLRLGLEVVFGEQIELQSHRDIVGLSSFIINRLFRDRYLEARNSKAYNLSTAYAEHMRKFTLRMVLFMLLFLDTAKRRKLIKHNPCLFARNAPHKETREILIRFASELVSGIGDITKHLKRVGYTLSHKQSFLDEFNYAFENLAVDLRDGVRLTRVMEIILLREDLSGSLRVPPISRLQKLHNINLALGALEQAEYQIAGNITAKDICDGHREQTMSLLWQIVYKFRAPKFNAAASVLQCWWRTHWLKVVIARRIEEKRRLVRERAARTIQAAVRGYCVRIWYVAMRDQKLRAVVILQRYTRRYLAQKLAARRFSAIVRIQQWWRSVREMRFARENFLTMRSAATVLQMSYRRYALASKLQAASVVIGEIRAEAVHRHRQAIVIQRSIKSYVIHRRLQSIVHGMVAFIRRKSLQARSATKIQSYQRMRVARGAFLRLREATVRIQRRWRECLEARRARAHFVRMQNSAILVQRYFRGYLRMRQDRERFQKTRNLMVQLQRRRRATIAMRTERNAFERLRKAAVCIQLRYRARKLMQIESRRYETLRHAAFTIQRRHRANKAMVEQRTQYDTLRVATLCIQRRFRAQLSMRAARESYVGLRRAAITIQVRYRATMLMRVERNGFILLRRCTVAIQCRFRAIVVGRLERLKYGKLRAAAIHIQRKWRATLEMRAVRKGYLRERAAATTLQRAWSAVRLKRKMRGDYLRYRHAATVLQRRYRALIQGRGVRKELTRRRNAATVIQRKLRATLQMRVERQKFLQLCQTVLTVQRRLRANRATKVQRTHYDALKRSVEVLSDRWQAMLAMRRTRDDYIRLKRAAIVMQRRFRAQRAMKQERQTYACTRAAVLLIQRKYRAHREMEKCRGQFLNLKSASIVVQEFYRGYRQMKKERATFERLREATIAVQRRFRGKLLMKRQMAEYGRKKDAAVTIQRWFRGHRAMVLERKRLIALRQAAIVFQRRYRTRAAMLQEKRQFVLVRGATVTIQLRWKAIIVMRRQRAVYRLTINAIRTIQTHYRAYKQRLVDEANYRLYRSAVIVVQRRYRAKLEARTERARFEQIRRTVRGLQRRGRGLLARRAFRAMLTPEYILRRQREKAALRIQAWWRGTHHRRRFQTATMRKIASQMVVSRREGQRDPSIRLSNVARLCMRFLNTRFSSTEAIGILQRLERMSRLVPHLLMDDAVFLAVFCYNTMAQAIRSELDKILIEICARIILNLARFKGTKEQAFQENGLVTVSQMLLRWCDKDCGIFSTLCTLLWVLAHDVQKKNAIRRYMISKDAIYMLRETKKLVQRKEKMRKNVQRPVGCLVAPNPQLMRTVPALEADFGVNRSKPYVFYSSVFGFERVLHMLDVNLS